MTGHGPQASGHGGIAPIPPDARGPRPVPLLLYDGSCGFCAASVQWVLRHDRRGTLSFAALQGETARPILARHPELANVDSVVWVEGREEAPEARQAREVVRVKSDAAIAVGVYLGGLWSVVARLGALTPTPIRDWCYDLIARHRHTIVRGDPACMLPTPDERKRFLP